MKASEAAIKQVYHLAAPFNRLHSTLFYLRTKICSPLPLSPSPSLQAPHFLDAGIRRFCPEISLLFKTILIKISPAFVTYTSNWSLYKTFLIIIILKGWTASHIDHAVPHCINLTCPNICKVSQNTCTASTMELGALTLLKYCSLYLAEGITSLTYLSKSLG